MIDRTTNTQMRNTHTMHHHHLMWTNARDTPDDRIIFVASADNLNRMISLCEIVKFLCEIVKLLCEIVKFLCEIVKFLCEIVKLLCEIINLGH